MFLRVYKIGLLKKKMPRSHVDTPYNRFCVNTNMLIQIITKKKKLIRKYGKEREEAMIKLIEIEKKHSEIVTTPKLCESQKGCVPLQWTTQRLLDLNTVQTFLR